MSDKTDDKKRLPMAKVNAARPASALAARPVRAGGSRPEFPTRSEAYLLGGLVAAGLAGAPAAAVAAPAPDSTVHAQVTPASGELGSIDGKALSATRPKIKIMREGGGIGPAEDVWEPKDVESFVSWTMAREGALALQSDYKINVEGTTVKLDGFDPARNIGYVYADQLSPALPEDARKKLQVWIAANKLAVLFLDVKRAPDPATLQGKVIKFVATTAKSPPSTARLPAADAAPAHAPTGKKR